DAAAYARAAAERNHRDARAFGPGEHGGDLRFVTRLGDEVGGRGEVLREAAHEIAEALPVRVEDALALLVGGERSERARRGDARGLQRHVLDAGDGPGRQAGKAEQPGDGSREPGASVVVGELVGPAPAPEGQLACAHA